MKNLFLTASIFLVAIVSLNAQTFGIKAGVNFANITGDNTEDVSSRTSFVGGFFAEIPMTDGFTFQPELLYSGQGAEFSFEDDGTTTEEVFKLDYLTIPFMFKYYVSEGLSVQAGPQLGILLSSKAEDVNTYDVMTKVDFGLNFGLGY